MPPEEDEKLRNSIYQSFHSSATPDLDQSEVLPQQTPVQGGDNGIESIQVLARLIDKLMSNVKIVFKDTCIRLFHHSTVNFNDNYQTDSESLKGYYFDLEIPNISFRDETHGLDDENVSTNIGSDSVTLPPALSETVKSVTISGLSVWIREALNFEVLSNNQKVPGEEEYEDEFYSQIGKKHNGHSQKQAYEAMVLCCVSEENLIRVTLRPNALPSVQMDFANVSSSYYYTQEAMQKANNTQSWMIEGFIKSVTAMLTPCQLALITDLVNALTNNKLSLETRSPSSTESDDDFTNEGTRVNGLPDKNQYQYDYRRMSQLPHDDYRIDDLIFAQNTRKSPASTLQSEIEPGQRKRGSSSSGFPGPHNIKNNSRENYPYYKTDQSSKQYFDSKINNSPPNYSSHHYKSPLSSRPSQQTVATPTINFKFDISTIQLHLLYQDPLPSLVLDHKFFNKSKENLNIDHLKIEINDFMCQIQSWEHHDNSSGSRRRSSSSASGHQKNSESDEMLRVKMDLSVSDLTISEWLKYPSPTRHESTSGLSNSGCTLPTFNSYNQLLCFDRFLKNSYDLEETNFPGFSVNKFPEKNHHTNGISNSRKSSSRHNFGLSKSVKSVIKIKLEIGSVVNEGIFQYRLKSKVELLLLLLFFPSLTFFSIQDYSLIQPYPMDHILIFPWNLSHFICILILE